MALASAKSKLEGKYAFDNLPANVLSPLWDKIAEKFNLQLEELAALQNERCKPSATAILDSAMQLPHQWDFRSFSSGNDHIWYCEATLWLESESQQRIELLVDTGCSVDLILPAELLARLGANKLNFPVKHATSGGGDVVLVQYDSLKTEIPLYEPKQFTAETYATTEAKIAKYAVLDAFTFETGQDAITNLIQKGALPSDKRHSVRRGSLPGVASVVLEPLTREKLEEKRGLAIIGLPGLKKLKLTLITEMHVLLPIKIPIEHV